MRRRFERDGDTLFPLALDVTDRKAVLASVAYAHKHFVTRDIIVSDAGWATGF